MPSRQLLVIGYVWPEPKSSAAGSRMLQLLQVFLQKGYRITYASPAALSPYRFNLPSLTIDEKNIRLNDSSFDEFVAELNPDAVLFDRFMMEEQFGWRVRKQCPMAMTLIETVDLHCLRQAREKIHKQRLQKHQKDEEYEFGLRPDEKELHPVLLQSEVARREVASIFRCDLSLMISSYETHLLKSLFQVPESILLTLPFMVDPESLSSRPFTDRKHFLHIGNFLHAPNWDAVLWLKQLIWPQVRKKLPQAELHLYGSYESQKVRDIHNTQDGFLIKGRTEDALQVMRDCRVNLAPLRFGAGQKGKLLDAMLTGTPSVTTDIGAETMFDNNWPGEIANNAHAFANKAVHLYQSEDEWQKKVKNIAPLIKQGFDEKRHFLTLSERIDHISANLSDHRQQNFVGQMLQHHLLKSNEYMSRWIEEKNKKATG